MAFNYYTIIIGFLIGFILFLKLPKIERQLYKKAAKKISISVIIPARNEEANLPNILSDLQKQTFNIHEIICVDDNSEDSTFDIIKKFGVKSVRLNNLPKGWKGKTWACQNGAKKASGDILLFLDADVRLSENAIESMVSRYSINRKPLSIQPYHNMKKQHEFFSIFFNLIQICATAMSIPFIKRKIGFYGPVLMVSKALFDRQGGYETVKDCVVEDFNLGRKYNKKGIDIDLLLGAGEIQFRMYPNSFADLFEGWSKNFSRGSISMQWWLLVSIIAWIAFLTALPIELIKTAVKGELTSFILLAFLYILNVCVIYRTAYNIGSYRLYVCSLYPIYLLIFHVIFVYSVIAVFVLKSTTWKGRRL